jgi:2-polyprenyl-3-methyl-5-hydroxy-6-metoxy-1,4-benzoquinol methylase
MEEQELRALMDRYTVDRLGPDVDAEQFRQRIESLPGTVYSDDPRQRPYDNVFTWGHDHDFGTFHMKGQMGDRHIRVIKAFLDMGVEFEGRVLDVGCWTGGTSLLLAAMGCEVTAIEEAEHYARVVLYLSQVFAIPGLVAWPFSVYDLDEDCGPYDMVFCAGVLYHVTDPVHALRIMFEKLVDGGKLLLETAVADGDGRALVYAGPQEPGYRWMLPTVPALHAMLEDVGFALAGYERRGSRALVVAERKEYVTMMEAGMPR